MNAPLSDSMLEKRVVHLTALLIVSHRRMTRGFLAHALPLAGTQPPLEVVGTMSLSGNARRGSNTAERSHPSFPARKGTRPASLRLSHSGADQRAAEASRPAFHVTTIR